MLTPLTIAGIVLAIGGIAAIVALGSVLHELMRADLFREDDDL